MIDNKRYQIILDEGLLLDHYALLLNINEGRELVNNKRIQGFINLMCKKGYIEDGFLTDKALELLGDHVKSPDTKPEIKFEGEVIEVKEEPKMNIKFDYADWAIALHRKCEQRLLVTTGKRQMRPTIEGKPYSFLPNSSDLARVIYNAIKQYKLKDYDKIEKTILRYIDKCIKANKWFPILGYYILKNKMSQMVTDMESDEEEDASQDQIVNI